MANSSEWKRQKIFRVNLLSQFDLGECAGESFKVKWIERLFVKTMSNGGKSESSKKKINGCGGFFTAPMEEKIKKKKNLRNSIKLCWILSSHRIFYFSFHVDSLTAVKKRERQKPLQANAEISFVLIVLQLYEAKRGECIYWLWFVHISCRTKIYHKFWAHLIRILIGFCTVFLMSPHKRTIKFKTTVN